MSASFVLVTENRIAFDAASAMVIGPPRVARQMGKPLTICGPADSGKSAIIKHLVKGEKTSARRTIICQSAVEWADEYRRADRDGATADWLHKLGKVKCLVLDDVEQIAGHAAIGNQLAAACDLIVSNGGRVVMTLAALPGRSKGFSIRLADRIRGGTIVSIDPLGEASREKFLRQFAAARQMPVEAEAITRLSPAVGTTAGEIKRTVEELEKRTVRRGGGLTVGIVGEYIRRKEVETPSIPQITKAVAREFSARVSDLRASGRSQSVVLPRQTAMFLAREISGEHYQKIGDYFGRRNHSTVVHSVRRIEQMLDDSPEFASRVVQIRSQLGFSA